LFNCSTEATEVGTANISSCESIVQAKAEWDGKVVEITSPKPRTRSGVAKSLLEFLKEPLFLLIETKVVERQIAALEH
jgi:hypothetical protein